MKPSKPTLTIGMSAHNEEQAFPSIIKALLKQDSQTFSLDTIIIISDGSTDETVSRIQRIKNKKLKLLIFPQRHGKALQINTIFKYAQSDIVVILDADISLPNEKVLEKLIAPLVAHPKVAGVSGSITPHKPMNFIQRVVYTGISLWDAVRASVPDAKVYYCTGAIRAFRKKLYKEMVFPAVSAEDVYPYLYCMSKGEKFEIVSDASVYYKLPATYTDYIHQMKRYLQSSTVLENYFDRKLLEKAFIITPLTRLRILMREFLKNPFWIGMYILFLVPVHMANSMNTSRKDNPQWEIATSSKL